MSELIGSSADFFAALTDVVNRYLKHFEPGSNPSLYTARLEAQGPEFNLTFVKSPDATPALQFTLHAEALEQEPERKGWRG